MEIEKKYLIWESGEDFSELFLKERYSDTAVLKENILTQGNKIRQGYLPVEIGQEIARIMGVEVSFTPIEARLRQEGQAYYFTLKSDGDLVRYESPDRKISHTVFELYWPYAKRRIEKVRFSLHHDSYQIEIDAYTDRDLITAEIELSSEDEVSAVIPVGMDITDNPKYRNKALATSDFLRKFILTGGPCSGKSSVIEYLQKMQYPIIPESARKIIDEQLRKGGTLVPWENFLEFQLEVLHTSLQTEAAFDGWGTVFLDRGIPDAIAYCINAGKDPPTPLRDAIQKQEYRGIFVLDPLPFRNDDARMENPEEAQRVHEALLALYNNLGFHPISIPVDLNLPLEESIRKRSTELLAHSFRGR